MRLVGDDKIEDECDKKLPTEANSGSRRRGCDVSFDSCQTLNETHMSTTPPATSIGRPHSTIRAKERNRKGTHLRRTPQSPSPSEMAKIAQEKSGSPSPSSRHSPRKLSSSAQSERVSRRSHSRQCCYREGDLSSYHRSTSDPFCSLQPSEFTALSKKTTLQMLYPHPKIAPLMANSLPTLPYIASSVSNAANVSSTLDAYYEKDQPPGNPPTLPQTVIDWTSPSTRRKEYAEIDKSCRGIRGLWRRISPQWCQRNRRLHFHREEDESDCGSVRRYRVDVLDEIKETTGSQGDAQIPEDKPRLQRPKLGRSMTSWSCFGDLVRGKQCISTWNTTLQS